MEYSHKTIEKKWQKFWADNKTFKTTENKKKKSYVLDMFPYPSGAGLHVGHPRGYTASDVYARFKRMNDYDVLHPIGWDAFGLPAEQYALATGNHPENFTLKNINNFRKQLKLLGFSFDYEKEINTSNPNYYKITQYMFEKLYENNLAKLSEVSVNWCAELGTVLANEEVLIENGKMVSERGNYPVIKKPMKQWVIKITKYAKKLLKDLDSLDWPSSVKKLQKNWIGSSQGLEITFDLFESIDQIKIFTTRADTIGAVTYIAIAPEHEIISKIVTIKQKHKVEQFLEEVKSKTDLERQDYSKEKNGIFSGCYAVNPLNNHKIPIWIADYVLPYYATGIVMGVPGHDLRDYAFAKKYKLNIQYVIASDNKDKVITGDGKHINSEFLNGLLIAQAKDKLYEKFHAKNLAVKKTYYRLKDWLFSRQRYWGEPFPIIYWEDGSISLVDKNELPLLLPKMKNITPSKDGQSPLANCLEWVNVVSTTGLKGRRETNTMPQWAASSWYYLAYILVKDDGKFLDIDSTEAQAKLKKWLPVDLYIGGQEHAVLHLLYARFWHKFLFDINLVPTIEPFQKLVNQGMILGPDGNKMSKSKGNILSPDEIIMSHGADALRLYEMFMGPLKASLAWDFNGLDGSRKWLDRVMRFYKNIKLSNNNSGKLDLIYNDVVKNITQMIENLELNIAISKLMTLLNAFYKEESIYSEYAKGFIKMLSPFAPHISEEIWSMLGNKKTITYEKWPIVKLAIKKIQMFTVVIQINGKLKERLILNDNLSTEQLKKLALKKLDEKDFIKGRTIKKIIVIPNKIVNIVI